MPDEEDQKDTQRPPIKQLSTPTPQQQDAVPLSALDIALGYEGRLGRMPFFLCWIALNITLIAVFIGIALNAEASSIPGGERGLIFIRALIFFVGILHFFLVLPLIVKRLHDIGRSGILALGFLIPIVNLLVVLALFFRAGTPGPNKYGPKTGFALSEAKQRGQIVVFLLLSAVGLGFAIYDMAQPQDLTDIQGHDPNSRAKQPRDVKMMLEVSKARSYPVTLTEGEINQWLPGVLQGKQGGLLADKVTLEGVWIRLEDGRAEVVMERRVMGKPFTVSIYLQIEQTETEDGSKTAVHFRGGSFHPYLPYPKCGGRFGRLPVPQGFLLFVLPAYKNLAAAFPDEIRLGFEEMPRIKIEKGRLTLDPRIPASTLTPPP